MWSRFSILDVIQRPLFKHAQISEVTWYHHKVGGLKLRPCDAADSFHFMLFNLPLFTSSTFKRFSPKISVGEHSLSVPLRFLAQTWSYLKLSYKYRVVVWGSDD